MKPRDYQEAAVQSIFSYFEQGAPGNPIVALPTGTGKSVVIAEFIRQAVQRYPGVRVMKLTHVKELIQQNFEKLRAVWPNAPAGIFSSGLGKKQTGYPIVFGGVGTVAKAARGTFGRVDLLLIDECHMVSPKDMTMYQRVITDLREVNPQLRVIGFTATPYRLGSGLLTEPGGLFTDVCLDGTQMSAFNWFLSEGYLCRLVPKPTRVQLDVTDVGVSGGEYKQKELQQAVDKPDVNYAAIQEMLVYGENRNHWLVFGSGIEHAINLCAILDSMGVPVTCVHSEMPEADRDKNLADFIAGRYRAMVNNGILTTGFDFPAIDMIAMLRPTKSPGLWVQMLGRGTRPSYAEGFDLSTTEGRLAAIQNSPKQNCLVLDFARNTPSLGPINDPVLPRKKGKKGTGAAPVKLCPECACYNHASVRVCAECGAEFPKINKLQNHAGTEELIASDVVKTERFAVDKVIYTEHRKEGKPPTIQASYFCGLRMFKEWVCLEHPGYAGKKARDWWRKRAAGPVPDTVEQATKLLSLLKTPSHVLVWLKPQYSEILGHDFEGKITNARQDDAGV